MKGQTKKEGARNKFVYSFLMLSLFILAVGVVFIYSNIKFTGMAVDDYTDQASCEGAGHGYIWENLTECPECIVCEADCVLEYTETLCESDCQSTCGENETSCIVCEADCVLEYTETLCESDCQSTCPICEEEWGCTGDDCDTLHKNLCLSETDCTSASGYWYNTSCNSEAQCVPITCAPANCGTISDGCGSNLECGSCSSDYTCSSSNICESDTPSSTGGSGNSEDEESDNEEVRTTTFVSTNAVQTSSCTPNWECGEWQECINETQVRVCTDLSECGSEEGIPETSQICIVEVKETCSDGVKNQDETGIDCGGSICDKCNIFTMVGSSISGTIDAGRKLIFEGMFGTLTSTIISVTLILVFVGGFVVLGFVFLKKKGVSRLDKVIDNLKNSKDN